MARYTITIITIAAIILVSTCRVSAEPVEFTVLTYNTHLFKGVNPTIGDHLPQYEDEIRRGHIIDKIAACNADIVALQEVWGDPWVTDYFIPQLEPNYPYTAYMYKGCDSYIGIIDPLDTLSHGLLLLSRWPLSGEVQFERFPTFFPSCAYDVGCENWANKGVLTADVNVGGVPVRIGISHALTRPSDEKSKWDTDYIGTAMTTFQLNGEAYIFALKDDNTGHIIRMEDYGTSWDEKAGKYNYGAGWKHIWQGPWGSHYNVITSFELDGHPYLFAHSKDTNYAIIYRINENPSTGWSQVWSGQCGLDYDVVVSFELDGHPYLFAPRYTEDRAHIYRIHDDPSRGCIPICDGPWQTDYDVVTSFELDGEPYIFGFGNDGQARIDRVNEEPSTGWTAIYAGPMSSEYVDVTSFELDGHPYLFALTQSNQGRIARINDDPYTGWTMLSILPRSRGLTAWYRFEGDTSDSSGNGHHGEPIGNPAYSADCREGAYSISLDGADDYVEVDFVGIGGNSPRTIAGWVKATKPAAEMPDWRGIFGFTGPGVADTHFDIQRNANSDHYCIHVYGWEQNIAPLDQEWHHLAATYDGKTITWYDNGNLVGSEARVLNTNDHVHIGRREDRGYCFPGLVDDVRIYERDIAQIIEGSDYDYASDYDIVVKPFAMNGHPYLFVQRNCCDQITCCWCPPACDSCVLPFPPFASYPSRCEPCLREFPREAHLKRINDDPSTGWEDLLQLEDIKIIRDKTVVDEDGPPAIMMGDFNIHANKYGIMDQLFRKAGAVDAYIEVHGTGAGGETVDLRNNKFYQELCHDDPATDGNECDPDDPRVYTLGRIDYVYVKQSGAGLRLIPTDANVIRYWKYYSEGAADMDLSDHYPVVAKFRLEAACEPWSRADFDCDGIVTFSDLAILCSAWISGPGDSAWDRACDIGDPGNDFIDMEDFNAFARAWMKMLPVHNLTQDKAYASIQPAIDEANDGDEIEVAPGTYYEAINFKGKAVTLRSTDPNDPNVVAATVIDGTGNCQVVQCVSGEDANTILDGFTITGGNATPCGWPHYYGGGMYNQQSSPTVTNCTFTGNLAISGGGMYNNNSNPTVTNCIFSGNSATGRAGGMYNYLSSPTVTDCNFSGNEAKGNGGGMYNDSSSPAVTNCNFNGNSADADGGGICNASGSDPNLTNCTFSNNSASGNGGGMDNYQSSPTVTDCNFSSNTSVSGYGGGMYNDRSSPAVTNCTFNGNSAPTGSGGAMYNNLSSSTIINTTLSGNTAGGNGGGMFNNAGTITITSCTFNGNSAGSGAAIRNWSSSPTVTDCNFNGNSADADGGGICNASGSDPNLTNCTFTNNSAIGNGGGMDNHQSSPTLTNCTFSGNSSGSYGGGMNNNASSPTVTNCSFSSNLAANSIGGGMHNRVASHPTVTHCNFTGNSASEAGGMFNDSSSPTVTNCTLSGNSATGIGGGMYNFNNSSPTVTNCTFS
ncbi:MAG: right-handed parallel beta-helix repeat-containing protein, partial [Planctomycetota bacterium]